jgi:hypothetical protein
MSINNTALTTTTGAIFTSAGNTVISTMHLCNYSGTSVQANIWLVPNGGSASTLTLIYGNVTITPYNTLVIDREKVILSNGDTVQANISTDGTTSATVSWVGI